MQSRQGRYASTFAHQDIAFEFASWISPEFKQYIVEDYLRLKSDENSRLSLNWNLNLALAKINYRIHTDAIKTHLVPEDISSRAKSFIYANEADVLNVALFGMTAKEWRDANPGAKGNMRDYASVNQLICLSNMENLNAAFINEGLPQRERLKKLNRIAIQQMSVLEEAGSRKLLK